MSHNLIDEWYLFPGKVNACVCQMGIISGECKKACPDRCIENEKLITSVLNFILTPTVTALKMRVLNLTN